MPLWGKAPCRNQRHIINMALRESNLPRLYKATCSNACNRSTQVQYGVWCSTMGKRLKHQINSGMIEITWNHESHLLSTFGLSVSVFHIQWFHSFPLYSNKHLWTALTHLVHVQAFAKIPGRNLTPPSTGTHTTFISSWHVTPRLTVLALKCCSSDSLIQNIQRCTPLKRQRDRKCRKMQLLRRAILKMC